MPHRHHPGKTGPIVPTPIAAVGKIGETFDADLDGIFVEELEEPAFTMSFTVEQLEAMLAEAKRKEATDARA